LDFTADADWTRVLEIRAAAQKALEEAKSRGIENPLDAEVVLPDPTACWPNSRPTSRHDAGFRVRLDRSARASRSTICEMNRAASAHGSATDGEAARDGGMLSDRDADAVGV